MIQIVKTNTYSKLEFISENPLDLETHKKCVAELHHRLAIFDPNARFSEKYNSFKSDGSRIWDGYIRFFNAKNFSFLTGHLPYIEKILDEQNVEYGIIDKCYRPNVIPKPVYELKGITLRDYQKKGVYICTDRTNRGVFYQATNSGKTIQAIATCESIPVNTLFLVDRVELLDQAYNKFKKHGTREVGVITPQEFEPREVTIGLQRTIWSKLRNQYTRDEYANYLKSVELLFADEVHKSTSSTWKYVLRHMHHAYYRYGLSGTPLLEDSIRNMFLVGFIGRIVQKISNQYLIENGYSAKPLINIMKRETERISSALDYAEVYRIGITESTKRNAQIVELIKKHSGETILVIVKHLEHGRIIKSSIEKEEGYFVSGQDSKTERISIYNKFKDKKIPVVIATMIYKEGIDISAIDVLIYAAGEKAPVTILQVLGRGLRARKDKKFLKYYDFEDKGHRHLSSHTRKRIKIYEKEEFPIEYIYEDSEITKCLRSLNL